MSVKDWIPKVGVTGCWDVVNRINYKAVHECIVFNRTLQSQTLQDISAILLISLHSICGRGQHAHENNWEYFGGCKKLSTKIHTCTIQLFCILLYQTALSCLSNRQAPGIYGPQSVIKLDYPLPSCATTMTTPQKETHEKRLCDSSWSRHCNVKTWKKFSGWCSITQWWWFHLK